MARKKTYVSPEISFPPVTGYKWYQTKTFGTVTTVLSIVLAIVIAFGGTWLTSSLVPNFGEVLRNVADIFVDHPFPPFEVRAGHLLEDVTGYLFNVLFWCLQFPLWLTGAFDSATLELRKSIFDGGYYDNSSGAPWPVVALDPA